MSVRWFCSHCSCTYNKQKKTCRNCHAMLSYECSSSHQTGLYKNYFRHIKSCVDCTSTYTYSQKNNEKNNQEDIKMEIENIDQGKKKSSCGLFTI
jgi:hypothetical protein